MADYRLTKDGVQRASDGAWIPNSQTSRAWREYQEWLAKGGVPDPEPPLVVRPPADAVEDTLTTDPTLSALVRYMAKGEGITERALLDKIRAEARAIS